MARTSTAFPLLRTYLGMASRSLKLIIINALSLLSLSATLAGFSLQNTYLVVVSFAGLAIGLAAIVVSAISWHRSVQDLRLHREPRPARLLEIPRRLADAGYEIIFRRGQPQDALLTSPQVNHALFNGSTGKFLVEPRRFRPSLPNTVAYVLLREFTQQRSVVLFNALKVRLATDLMLAPSGSLEAVKVQPTRYFDTMITNNSIGVMITSCRTRDITFDGTEACFPRHLVPVCDQSSCANQIGTSTIAVTADHYLVLVEQSRRSNLSRNLLAPSGSGSADWKDAEHISDLQQFVKRAAGRELTEECGLTETAISWMRIIGFGRILQLGGLPQFFCLAKLECLYERIKISRPERSLIDYHIKLDVYGKGQTEARAILEAIRSLRKQGHRISSSLWWNSELLERLPADSLRDAFANAS